tara:strand:- start:215 stop:397 length:183 start_codon:yes stop_codon:yes gene_type:complete
VNKIMPNNDDHTITYICEKCKHKEVKEKKYVGGEFCKPLEEITQEDWDNFDNLEHTYYYE